MHLSISFYEALLVVAALLEVDPNNACVYVKWLHCGYGMRLSESVRGEQLAHGRSVHRFSLA